MNNDFSKYVSMKGYKKNSPDRNNPMNIIPSGKITMIEDDGTPLAHPVMAIKPDGGQVIMQPGKNYDFGKGPILEVPAMYNYDEMFGKLANTKPLPKAQYGGDQVYTFSGRPDSQYKNVNGKWHIQNDDTHGNFVEIKDPTGKRSAVLNKQAKPVYSKQYDLPEMQPSETTKMFKPITTGAVMDFTNNMQRGVATQQANVKRAGEEIKSTIKKIEQNKTYTKEQKKEYIDNEVSRLLDYDKRTDLENMGAMLNNHDRTHFIKAGGSEPKTTGDYAERAWDIATNPFDAAKYSISGGGLENMPWQYNKLKELGYDPSAQSYQERFSGSDSKSNLVGDALNSLNLLDAGDKTYGHLKKGNWEDAAMEASRFLEVGAFLKPAQMVSNVAKAKNVLNKAGNYLTENTNLQNVYKYNPKALKEAQEQMLVRARPVGQDPYINTAEQLKAKQAAGEQLTWYQKNLLNPQTNPQMAAREKYFGQWFADNPSDLDFYINPATRNFADDAQIELLKTRMPKSEAAKYNIKNFEDAKTLSNLHDSEYILPKNMVQQLERYPVDELPKLIEEYKQLNTPHWLKGYPEVPKELPGSFNVTSSTNNAGKSLTFTEKKLNPIIDHVQGATEAIFDPFRYALTSSQKNKLVRAQDDALEKALKFTEEWNFNPDGTINNTVKERMKYLTEDERTKEALDSYNRYDTSIYNPMEKPNKLASSRRKDLELSDLTDKDKAYITKNRTGINGANTSDASITLRNTGNYYKKPEKIAGTVVHESGHSIQDLGQKYSEEDGWSKSWGQGATKFDKKYGYYTSNKETEAGREFAKHMVEPKEISPGSHYDYQTWTSSPNELHSDLMTSRYKLVEKLSKNKTKEFRDDLINRLRDNPTDADIDLLLKNDLHKFFKSSTSQENKRKLIRMLPALIPAIGTAAAIGTGSDSSSATNVQQQKYGGSVEDLFKFFR